MTAYPAWTPASRPGIVPLHPLTFGTILGRSFVALRQNPRVLLGFALVVQTLVYIVVIVAVGAISLATFSRLDTLRPGTEEFEAVVAGSVVITAGAGLLLGLAASAVTVIVQGVVVMEVTRAVVAERLTLGSLWRRVRPVFWRLFGYSLLVFLAVTLGLALLAAIAFGIGVAVLPLGIVLGILFLLGLFPLYWWLSIKLLLVPSTILIERATIRTALVRSWRLTRGRFWSSLGVIFLISLTFGAIGQVVAIPFSFLTTGLTTIIAPTGEPNATAIITLLLSTVATYALLLLIQSIAVVVQSTATALIYVDCRMRQEGLDLDLMEYVEKRDAGGTGLDDPYLQSIGRDRPSPALAYPPPPPQGYAPAQGYPPPQGYAPPQGYPPPPGYAPPQEYSPPPQGSAPSSTTWAAPGAGPSDREGA